MEKKDMTNVITRCLAGDTSAQEELVLAVQQRVYYHCRKMLGNEDRALDLTQDVLLTMLIKLDTLQYPAYFWSWLGGVTANLCRNAINRGPRELQIPEDEEGNSLLDTYETWDEQTVPDKVLDNEETRRMIAELVDALPAAQRQCVLLYYYEELSVREIARILNVSENTIKSRLNYARKSIKEGVDRYEKQGVKLYSVSLLPFLLFFLGEDAKACGLPAEQAVRLTRQVVRSASVVTAGTAAAAGGAAAGAAKTAAAAAGKGLFGSLFAKIAAGTLAGVLLTGGVTGGVLLHHQRTAARKELTQMEVSDTTEDESGRDLQAADEKATDREEGKENGTSVIFDSHDDAPDTEMDLPIRPEEPPAESETEPDETDGDMNYIPMPVWADAPYDQMNLYFFGDAPVEISTQSGGYENLDHSWWCSCQETGSMLVTGALKADNRLLYVALTGGREAPQTVGWMGITLGDSLESVLDKLGLPELPPEYNYVRCQMMDHKPGRGSRFSMSRQEDQDYVGIDLIYYGRIEPHSCEAILFYFKDGNLHDFYYDRIDLKAQININ